jgi:hypothetical protein
MSGKTYAELHGSAARICSTIHHAVTKELLEYRYEFTYWTPEEDSELTRLFQKSSKRNNSATKLLRSMNILSPSFRHSKAAIAVRLEELGLISNE